MGDWYFDNNRNISKSLIDSVIPVIDRYGKNAAAVAEEHIYDVFPPEYAVLNNKKSVLSCMRDFGVITEKNKMTDTTFLYAAGKLSFEEYVLELISKRNDSKKAESSLKPFVALCILFDLMYELGIDNTNIFLDKKECAHFLVGVSSYDEINNVLVNTIVSGRGSTYAGKTDYLGIWYNKLNETPFFRVENGKVYPFLYQREFYKFISTNRDCVSFAPSDSRAYQNYFESQTTGIVEVIPELPLNTDLRQELVEEYKDKILAYLFGYGYKNFEDSIFFSEECFGIYKAFYAIPRVAVHKIAQQNEMFANILWTSRHICLESKLSNKKMLRVDRATGGCNEIYYGIPGCGKSYTVSNEVLSGVEEKNIFRTTFFLDYSNADFVGQLLPKTENGKVTYEPFFGPFTKALSRAYETDEMVYLVIEEINRGNAAAIFGDLFQLLDRLTEKKAQEKGGNWKEGDSEYPITNNFIETYLGISQGEVVIPSNLSVIATMNTSDQNVFPLDTAFKRRWDRKKVVADWEEVDFADKCIPYTDFSWKQFVTSINTIIDGEKAEGTISEDKKIGPFFISEDILAEEDSRHERNDENDKKWNGFMTNVVDYLFNDVTQFDHTIIFSEPHSFEKVYVELMTIPNIQSQQARLEKFLKVFANQIKSDVRTQGLNSHENNSQTGEVGLIVSTTDNNLTGENDENSSEGGTGAN